MEETKVLDDVKLQLGSLVDQDHFDRQLIIHINSVVSILRQLGNFQNTSRVDETTTWDEIIEGYSNAEMIKDYIYMKVKMIFDTPTGAMKEAHMALLDEMEKRINYQTDI